MENIHLNDNLKLSFENSLNIIRLIVSNNDEELVCRKVQLKRLFSFAEVDKEHLFKGRVQLFKSGNKIDIQVKNEIIGTISNEMFHQTLNKLR